MGKSKKISISLSEESYNIVINTWKMLQEKRIEKGERVSLSKTIDYLIKKGGRREKNSVSIN